MARIEAEFAPLVDECKTRNRALRIGTNHGSLSDRIMNRYGDTPLGMVESALEFARIARDRDFHNFKFSMKSSNPKVMIECYRLLAARLAKAAPVDARAQVAKALHLATSREPTAEEVDDGLELIHGLKAKAKLDDAQALQRFCLLVLNLNEFLYLD